jgi:prephenate dehydrogenase
VRLGIVGTGLIGASAGLRARAGGRSVTGWDRDPEHLRQALALGALDAAAAGLPELLASCDELLLAVPVPATLELVARLASDPPPARAILDVASVKLPVVRAASGLSAFVATHPIAGSERSGPGAARTDLFEGRAWTYEPGAREPARSLARALIEELGARPVPLASADHDRIIALTSHLPQLLAVALGKQVAAHVDEPGVLELCGPGIGSMTRLAASPWSMWRGIFTENGQMVAQEVRILTTILSEAAAALESDSPQALEEWFATAAGLVARLQPNGTAAERVVETPDP